MSALRTCVILACFAIGTWYFLVALYHFLSMLGSISQKNKGAQFLGPLIFFVPSLFDDASRQSRTKAFVYLMFSLLLFGLFVLAGEFWPR